MTRLISVEIRRCLARRLTRALIGLGLLVSAVAGIVVFAQNEKQTPEVVAAREAQRAADAAACAARLGPPPQGGPQGGGPPGDIQPVPDRLLICRRSSGGQSDGFSSGQSDETLRLTALWSVGNESGDDDAILAVTATFLGIGALLGGASMVGAEWKAGTFTTVLTWEPRRTRVAVAKILAAGSLATVVAIALQLVFSAALLPAFLVKGTTAGADAQWLRTAAGGVARSGLLAGIAAVAGASIAMIGRNTSTALGAAFAYLAVGEAVIRGWKPHLGRWLVGENSAIFLTGRRLESAPFDRSFAVATLTLAAMATAVVVLAAVSLERRDVAG